MAEYIEKEKSTEMLKLLRDKCKNDEMAFALNWFLRRLSATPAADVAPVRHGRWIWDEDGMDWGIGSWRCSECQARPETWWQGERSSPLNKSGHYYCPNCGAKMENYNDI